ncbi:MAG: hypothetical protein ABID64_00035 [Nitrospirota bacterium]
MTESINIKEVKKISSKIKNFEKEEWLLADIEHYGKPRNFEKIKVEI